MPPITIANVDWSILDDVRAALAAATEAGQSVFPRLAITTSAGQAAQCQLQDSPVAILRYVTTREDISPEDARGCCLVLELILAVQADGDGMDESPGLEAALRLKNAAINAVESDPPEAASAWGNADHYQDRIRWGRPAIDASAQQPWAICRLPLEIGFILDGGTDH